MLGKLPWGSYLADSIMEFEWRRSLAPSPRSRDRRDDFFEPKTFLSLLETSHLHTYLHIPPLDMLMRSCM
jgi:hypothetical protein